jgi:hypothetical protein
MKPKKFPEANMLLKAPPGLEDEVSDLTVFKNENVIISCWELNEEEKKQVQETGTVWLGVMSQTTMPPVYIMVQSPFEELRERIQDNKKKEGWLP